ncbi:ABC transporter substrate-binding protein [Desulfosarcina ovata]|uniref:ABC transporter substrate-binding protein n=1 Tax=Desulfosarcina ovata subsp. ovata TaxID=2752305 RepID=A0A5K8A9D8_9BACT|nr:ABC transporter substrate-binding protein [Desulfosarcina ovata]BBO88660.1 ABC transporter substrate-binding protein [Desulfosarcina ovata subsp. ovata]
MKMGFRNGIVLWFMAVLTGIAATGGTAGAGESASVRFAFQDRIGSVMPIVAVSKGFFAGEGLAVKPLRFSSGPACAEALYSGAADIGAMGDTTAVITVARSPRFTIVASHATGEHRHRIMIHGDSGFTRLDDLTGRRIGVKKGTSTYGGLLAALERAKLSQSMVQIVDLTPPIMSDALMAGSLDAFAASEPTPSVAEQKGARELITLGGLGNLYPILILANQDRFSADADVLIRFLRALRRAGVYAAEHPDETVALMAVETGLQADTTRKAMARHDYQLRLDQAIRASLAATAGFLKHQQIIDHVPDFNVSADSEYLDACRLP